MKINIKEKFDILGKLTALSAELTEHQESKALCDRAIYEFKKGVHINSVSSFVRTLNAYNWIEGVDSFINEYNTFLVENQVGMTLENILNVLESSQYVDTYADAISAISELVPNEEAKIKENLHTLENFRFIPQLRAFLESYEKEAFAVTKTDKAEVSKNHISPVMVTESGIVFNLFGVNYEVDDKYSNISVYEGELSKHYQYGISGLTAFERAEDNSYTLHTHKGYVKIVAVEEGANKFFINENEFIGKDSITSALTVTDVVNYFYKKTKSLIEFMYENAHTFADIEIVKTIKSVNENLAFAFINLAESKVVLNKINYFERTNELVELTADNIDSIKESFMSTLGLDIAPVLENIKVNVKAIEVTKLVDGLEVSNLIENEEAFKAELAVCTDMFAGFSAADKEEVKATNEKLDSVVSLVESKKVSFLLESRAKFASEEVEGKEEVLSLLNTELAELIK